LLGGRRERDVALAVNGLIEPTLAVALPMVGAPALMEGVPLNVADGGVVPAAVVAVAVQSTVVPLVRAGEHQRAPCGGLGGPVAGDRECGHRGTAVVHRARRDRDLAVALTMVRNGASDRPVKIAVTVIGLSGVSEQVGPAGDGQPTNRRTCRSAPDVAVRTMGAPWGIAFAGGRTDQRTGRHVAALPPTTLMVRRVVPAVRADRALRIQEAVAVERRITRLPTWFLKMPEKGVPSPIVPEILMAALDDLAVGCSNCAPQRSAELRRPSRAVTLEVVCSSRSTVKLNDPPEVNAPAVNARFMV
jgi:hypothetical protein